MSATPKHPITHDRSGAHSLHRLVGTRWNHYGIWRRQMPDDTCPGKWTLTAHTLRARTDDEAQSKLRRMFASAGLTAMSLVAVPSGKSPNH